MGSKNKTRTRLKIIGAAATAVFSLASAFAGTYAWFATCGNVTATNMSITIVAPEQLEYELYYLSSFTDGQSVTHDGNQNSTTNIFSGYQLDYSSATFTKVNYVDGAVSNDPDPTNISHLWPAHKLTYAFVITQSSMEKLAITSWNETTGAASVSDGNPVCLSWAINIYGAAFNVSKTQNTANDVATGYASYFAAIKTDVFDYSQASPASTPREEIVITDDIPANEEDEQTIVYFTIEFSNDVSTFYKLNKTTGYYELYVSGETVGFNSNCYEGLSLSGLTLRIA